MTLTVQDLVTRFDEFSDDAKVKVKRYVPSAKTSVIRDIIDIKKDDDGNVILVTELAFVLNDVHEEDEESEDEESEDEESKDEESEE